MNKSKLADKVIDKEKKKLKKKTKRTLHRILFCIFSTIGLFCIGYLFGRPAKPLAISSSVGI